MDNNNPNCSVLGTDHHKSSQLIKNIFVLILLDMLHDDQHINEPAYSQPLTTALQMALVELLKSFGIVPSAVVGHSSGEIAAAYCAGALSLASACKVAYFRGKLSSKLQAETADRPGAMLSANIPVDSVAETVSRIVPGTDATVAVTAACINSPTNVTLSGPEGDIDSIKEALDKDGVFAQKLQTGGMAYHSPAMEKIAADYHLSLRGELAPGDDNPDSSVPMISTLTGKMVTSPRVLSTAQYWVDNLISPVRFSEAMSTLMQQQQQHYLGVAAKPITDVVEVGPHPALRRPIQDNLDHIRGTTSSSSTTTTKRTTPTCRYQPVLKRSCSPVETTLQLVGQLFCHGYPVSVSKANETSSSQKESPPAFLVDCPEYPFDHSNTYWAEPRVSRDYRLRPKVPADSLGERVNDWNPLEPRWRRLLSIETCPWTRDHNVSSAPLTFLAMHTHPHHHLLLLQSPVHRL